LAMRAEFSRENQVDKWQRQQARLAQRRASKQNYWQNQQQPQYPTGQITQNTFGVPNDKKEE